LSKKTVRELAETVIFQFFFTLVPLFFLEYISQYFGRRSALSEVYSASIGSKRRAYCFVANNMCNPICQGVEGVHSKSPLCRVFACIS